MANAWCKVISDSVKLIRDELGIHVPRGRFTRIVATLALMVVWSLLGSASSSANPSDAAKPVTEEPASVTEAAQPTAKHAGVADRQSLNAMTALVDVLRESMQKELLEELEAAELAVSASMAEDQFNDAYFKLRDSDPDEANRQSILIRTHERNLSDSNTKLSFAIICLTAESKKVRTRPEDVDKARQELDSLRKQLPKGEEELVKLGRDMLAKKILCEEASEKHERIRKDRIGMFKAAYDGLNGLPVALEDLFFSKYEKLRFDLDNLKSDVRSARVREIKGTHLHDSASYAQKRSEFDAIIKAKTVVKLDREGESWTLEIR